MLPFVGPLLVLFNIYSYHTSYDHQHVLSSTVRLYVESGTLCCGDTGHNKDSPSPSRLHYLRLVAPPSSSSSSPCRAPPCPYPCSLVLCGGYVSGSNSRSFLSRDLPWRSSAHIVSSRQGRLGKFCSHVARGERGDLT